MEKAKWELVPSCNLAQASQRQALDPDKAWSTRQEKSIHSHVGLGMVQQRQQTKLQPDSLMKSSAVPCQCGRVHCCREQRSSRNISACSAQQRHCCPVAASTPAEPTSRIPRLFAMPSDNSGVPSESAALYKSDAADSLPHKQLPSLMRRKRSGWHRLPSASQE